MALFAVTRDRAVGVDIEYCRPFPGMMDFAQRFFSASEYATMRSLEPAMQIPYFYTVWTCKEAYLKATSEGLNGLERLGFSVPQHDHAVWLTHGIGVGTGARWVLRRLEPPAGYAAALVAEGNDWDLIEISDSRMRLDGHPGEVSDACGPDHVVSGRSECSAQSLLTPASGTMVSGYLPRDLCEKA